MAERRIERSEQMFPTLSDAQVERLAKVGTRRAVAAGEVLYERGVQNGSLFLVLDGALEIQRPTGPDARPERIRTLGPGQFTGEINMLSARRALASAHMATAGAVIAVDREALRAIIQRDSELSEIMMRAFILRRVSLIADGGGDLILLGSHHSAPTQRLREFLTRNAHPFTYADVETHGDVQDLLDRFHVAPSEVPVIVCQGGKILRNPSPEALAVALGLSPSLDGARVRDLVVVGAGPAGLAAAVYAASEGLDVLVLESTAPGGQAGTSSRIENYLGFPTGISGEALAGRALSQAEKFGAEVAIGRTAARLDCDHRPYAVHLADGETVRTRTIVIACGARYRKLAVPSLPRFEGAGVFYSATHLEAQPCAGREVAVVGGGNSAGQAAVFLSSIASHVNVLVRGAGLAASMSRYLIERITNSPTITLRTQTEVTTLDGAADLERVTWQRLPAGELETRPVTNLFVMTGADPNSEWLEGCVLLDAKRFVKTGADLTAEDLVAGRWPLARRPTLLETTIPGVFAVGDIRAESVKRVASAVGEGSICVQLVHRALAE
jgi:thioredoxin reductase (NADPH)